MKKAVFLDKDGTLVKDIPYNADPQKITFYEDVARCLQRLAAGGFKLIVVSNQSGVAKGYFDEDALRWMLASMTDRLSHVGAQLDAVYYCPHHPCGIVDKFSVECECRKPKPGLILKAASDHGIDVRRSWMIGDILNDVEAGNRAGCRTILINNGNETEWVPGKHRAPDYIVDNLIQATDLLLLYDREAKYDYQYYQHN